MNDLRNYKVYLEGMAKGMREKLFFLDHIDLHNYETIIDFGCGGGDILATIDKLDPLEELNLVGIDCDDIMRETTKHKVPRSKVFASWTDYLAADTIGPWTCIIFSSVLHEIEDYWQVLKKSLEKSGATVIIRDMRFTGPDTAISNQDLSNLIRNAHSKYLSEFTARYGLATNKDMVHYLLKYSYVDNWALELAENYFSFDYNDLFSIVSQVLYENNYALEFKKKRIFEDFKIKLTNGTHTQLIVKC